MTQTHFLLPALFAIVLSIPLSAQQGLRLDADGNYIPSYERGLHSTPGPDAPGSLRYTIQASNGAQSSGFAPRSDAPGHWFNLSGGNAEIYRIDDSGVVERSLPVTDVNDSWPGLDASRHTLICVNALDDTMSGYDATTGAPLFRFPTPTAGPVGAAYDTNLDAYWYSDWITNELVALDADDAQGGVSTEIKRISTAANITRIAGVAYNCLDNTVVSGGRDQGMQVAYDATTDAVVDTWAVVGGSINDPQGCGLAPQSSIITTDFQDLDFRVHEGTTGLRPDLYAIGSQVLIIGSASSTVARIGHSGNAGRDVIKGFSTCLSRRGIVNGGTIPLSGGIGGLNIGMTGRAIQALLVPSMATTNVQFN